MLGNTQNWAKGFRLEVWGDMLSRPCRRPEDDLACGYSQNLPTPGHLPT